MAGSALYTGSLIAIDPGVYKTACALYRGGRLYSVGYGPDMQRVRADRAVCEKPQFDARVGVYNIDLAVAGAFLAGRLSTGGVVFTEPRHWKGSRPKPVHHQEAWAELLPRERSILPADTYTRICNAVERGALDRWRKSGGSYYGRSQGSDVHNLLDAVALGLWYLGRLK